MLDLMPHQKEAVSKLSNGKILCGGVGSGKTRTILQYYLENHTDKDLYVITTAKKRDSLDWDKDAVRIGMGRESSVHGKLVIDSWNNISKYKDVEDAYFVFDEQRVVGYGAWSKNFIRIARANQWNLLSATPGDTWMDYIPVFLANNLYKNKTEFLREHVVFAPYSKFPKVMRYTGVSTLEKWRNLLLVEMPFERHTERILCDLTVSYDEALYQKCMKERWNPYTDAPMKDVSELFRVLRRVVYEDPSRQAAVKDLIKKHPKIVIFYNFNYELEALRMLGGDFVVAEWNGQKKEAIPNTDSWVYLVQYVAGAEGWNCTDTDAMVFHSQTYSYKNFEQAQGRIDRLDTPYVQLYYYILTAHSVIERAISDVLAGKGHFNELAWAKTEFGISNRNFGGSDELMAA